MTYRIENEQIPVQVLPYGAELCSVKSKINHREYIWQADPTVWARHAPVLFPIVGRLNGDQYRLHDKTYAMSQHGFARDKDFKCIHQTDDQLSFQLSADEETKERYPFDFLLTIHYTLKGNLLAVQYQVENRDKATMPFSIGAHPAFYCPAQADKHWEEYQLLFEQNEILDRHFIEGGLRTGQTKRLLDDEHIMALHRHLFEDDAVIFYHPQSQWVSIILQSTGEKIVTVYREEFPYLGIWQKTGADFYCIEPWHGVTDKQGFEGEITQKEGIMLLEPAEIVDVGYSMEFHI